MLNKNACSIALWNQRHDIDKLSQDTYAQRTQNTQPNANIHNYTCHHHHHHHIRLVKNKKKSKTNGRRTHIIFYFLGKWTRARVRKHFTCIYRCCGFCWPSEHLFFFFLFNISLLPFRIIWAESVVSDAVRSFVRLLESAQIEGDRKYELFVICFLAHRLSLFPSGQILCKYLYDKITRRINELVKSIWIRHRFVTDTYLWLICMISRYIFTQL